MDQRERNIQVADAIDASKSIAIMLNKNSTVDSFSAAVGLYFLLKDKGKQVDFVYQDPIPQGCENLIDKTLIKADADKKELVVSIDYSASPDAKAQYSTSNGILYIKLSPVKRNFDISKVQIEVNGQQYDLIFTIGAQTPDQIGKIYSDLKGDLPNAKVVNVDVAESNEKYGYYNAIEPSEQFVSLLILNSSRFWRLKVTPSSARALLNGISYSIA